MGNGNWPIAPCVFFGVSSEVYMHNTRSDPNLCAGSPRRDGSSDRQGSSGSVTGFLHPTGHDSCLTVWYRYARYKIWTSQGFADTSLRIFRHGFKCLRADPAEMAVSPDVIIEGLDVLVDIRYSHRSSSVDAFLDPLFL